MSGENERRTAPRPGLYCRLVIVSRWSPRRGFFRFVKRRRPEEEETGKKKAEEEELSGHVEWIVPIQKVVAMAMRAPASATTSKKTVAA